MTSNVRVIGCVSSHIRQRIVFSSLVRVLAVSEAGIKWVYRDEEPFDVTILDLDDEPNIARANAGGRSVIVVTSSQSHLLTGKKYILTKPLRGQEFLQLLKVIEATDL